jgi:CcmD family protein
MDLQPGPAPAPKPATTTLPVPTTPPAVPTGTTADDRSTTFRPVEGGNQMQSGEKLLVEAYAAIWIILFAMVLLSWRRQKKIDERIGGLESAVEKARDEASAKGGR